MQAGVVRPRVDPAMVQVTVVPIGIGREIL